MKLPKLYEALASPEDNHVESTPVLDRDLSTVQEQDLDEPVTSKPKKITRLFRFLKGHKKKADVNTTAEISENNATTNASPSADLENTSSDKALVSEAKVEVRMLTCILLSVYNIFERE